MRYGVLSDIHSNQEALSRALDYIDRAGINTLWVLGDIVGYGASPQEVCDGLFARSPVVILGNHDQAIFDNQLLDWFNEEARKAILWTRQHLAAETIGRLAELPDLHVAGGVTLAHASPRRPETYPYIVEWKDAAGIFRFFDTPICFIGHTHVPQLFSEKKKTTTYLIPGTYHLDRDDRYLINCGSLGQPRDWDKRLCFGIFDDERYTFEIVRLVYDRREAARKIQEAGLPQFFADRLL